MYRHTYQVVGSGQFPIDMLRYDGSYPESESQDSSAIHAALNRFHPVPPEVPAAVVAAFGGKVSGTLLSHPATQPHPSQRGWVVTLVHEGLNKAWQPEAGRWASFLWYVVPKSLRAEKR